MGAGRAYPGSPQRAADGPAAGVEGAQAAAASPLPSALDAVSEIVARMGGRRPVFLFDYDGTLSPIVDRPEDAVLPAAIRDALQDLLRDWPVAIVTGRDASDVRERVGLRQAFYAGSHGFDLIDPDGVHHDAPDGARFVPALDAAEAALRDGLRQIAGVRLDRKRFALAVHYRQVADADLPRVMAKVTDVLAGQQLLRRGEGKKVVELRPDLELDKGTAIAWLLRELALAPAQACPLFIGDDVTDEDAFRMLRAGGGGIGILVGDGPTAAEYRLADPDEVCRFVGLLARRLRGDEAPNR